MRKIDGQHGFTLIELMMVVIVTAILITVAVPSMKEVLDRNAQQSTVADLSNTLAFARSEAISRGQIISVCQSSDGSSCSTVSPGDWSMGWIVFVDPTPPTSPSIAAVVDPNEIILRVHGAVVGGGKVLVREGLVAHDAKTSIRISRTGFLNAIGPSQALLTVCRQSGVAGKAIGIFINASGQLSFTRDSDSDGVQDFQGSGGTEALSCAI